MAGMQNGLNIHETKSFRMLLKRKNQITTRADYRLDLARYNTDWGYVHLLGKHEKLYWSYIIQAAHLPNKFTS